MPLIFWKKLKRQPARWHPERQYLNGILCCYEVQYSWPVLSGLLKAAACENGHLRVLDLGGALGSSYYQNRKFLEQLKEVKWCIVEQGNFVECGKREFETDVLKFFHSIEEAAKTCIFNVILLSGVLPYLEKTYDMFDGQIKGRNDSWAIRWYAMAFLKNKLTLYPGCSLLQNIGNDLSGSNRSSKMDTQPVMCEHYIKITKIQLCVCCEALHVIGDYLEQISPGKHRFINFIRRLLNA